MKLPKFNFRRKQKDLEQAVGEDSPRKVTAPSSGSPPGIKKWFLQHVEKMLLFATLVVFGLLIYSASGKLELRRGQVPEKLSEEAENLISKINKPTWDETSYPVPDFAKRVETAARKVQTDDYHFDSLTGVATNAFGKRTRPDFLPTSKPWVMGGTGIFWVRGEPNQTDNSDNKIEYSFENHPGVAPPENSVAEVKHWVAVTALVPVVAQRDIYDRHFQGAEGYDKAQDVPQYMLARIQRIEVSPYGVGDTLDWEQPDVEWVWGEPSLDVNNDSAPDSPISLERLDPGKYDRWASEAPEIVDSRYIHPRLTTPLGPLAYISWDRWATHPEIPTKRSSLKIDLDRPNDIPPKSANQAPKKTKANAGVPVRHDRFQDFTGRTDGGTVAENEEPPTTEVQTPRVNTASQTNLLRIFDFEVIPGKTYRYRVQLALKNPNYEQPARFLKNPEDRKKRFTAENWLPWSEPSDAVQIPFAKQVFVESVDQSKDSPATVLVQELDGQSGEIVSGRLALDRGAMVTGSDENQVRGNAILNQLSPYEGTIDAGALLLDLHGGQSSTPGDAPSEMLFFDLQSNLFSRDSVNDLAVVKDLTMLQDYYSKQQEKKKATKQKEGDEDEQADKELGNSAGKKKTNNR